MIRTKNQNRRMNEMLMYNLNGPGEGKAASISLKLLVDPTKVSPQVRGGPES